MKESEPTSFYQVIRKHLDSIEGIDKDDKLSERQKKELRIASDEEFAQSIFLQKPENVFSKRNGISKKKTVYGPVLLNYLCRICFALNISPEKLLLNKKNEDQWFEQNENQPRHRYFTRDYWEKIKVYRQQETIWDDFDVFRHHNPKENKELETAYKKAAPILKNAKEKIIVHELLFKGDYHSPESYEIHNKAQAITYKAITKALKGQKKVKSAKFLYQRIFFLSGSNRLFAKDEKSQWLQAFVAEASYETLEHILFCLKKYGKYCQFAVIGESHSLRHKVVIDDRYLMIEDYKYKKGTTTPESLCLIDLKDKKEAEITLDFIETAFPERDSVEINDVAKIEKALVNAIEFCEKEARSRKEILEFLNKEEIKGQLSVMNVDKIGNKKTPPDISKLKERIKKTGKMYGRQASNLGRKNAQLYNNKYLT